MTTAAAPSRPDRVVFGAILMIAFCILAPLLDVSSKLAAQTLPVGQITLARFVVQAALMLPVAALLGTWGHLTPRVAALIFLRAAFLVASTYCFIAGIAIMPIADALAATSPMAVALPASDCMATLLLTR